MSYKRPKRINFVMVVYFRNPNLINKQRLNPYQIDHLGYKQETLKNSVTKEEWNKSNNPPNLALQLNITGSADYVLLKVLGERRFNAGPFKPLQSKLLFYALKLCFRICCLTIILLLLDVREFSRIRKT